jgi:small-conductance mechanosensitive channel
MKFITSAPRVWLSVIILCLNYSIWAYLNYIPHPVGGLIPLGLTHSMVVSFSQGILYLSIYSVIVSLISVVTRKLCKQYRNHTVLVRFLSLSRVLKVGIFLFLVACYEANIALGIPVEWGKTLAQVNQVAIIGVIGWGVALLIQVGEALLIYALNRSARDNKDIRRRYTYLIIIKRILIILLSIATVAAILMRFEQIRATGTALLASAGLLTTIIALSARPLLENIFKGLQLAFSQPIRLEDTITINGETGTVTAITLHYVVVTLSDRSQLIVPTSDFLGKTFKNWTHSSDDLIGNILLYIDYNRPLDPIRKKFQEILQASEFWDKGIGELQVSDFSKGSVELKLVISAKSGQNLSKLRNEIREKLFEYMQQNHSEVSLG